MRAGTRPLKRGSPGFGARGLNCDISGEGFESLAAGLDDGDGYMTGLAGVDVCYGAGFAGVGAAEDFAVRAVLQFA